MSTNPKLRRWRNVARFAVSRSADYGQLFVIELAETRLRIVREVLAVIALIVSGLLTLSFFCLAAIASAWHTRYFLFVAWGIAIAWLAASLAALMVVRAQKPAQAFSILERELRADIETLREALK
ncbi:phage holin family protein [Paraburkholderia sp. A1RI-2L]|uniref:phage holin family protein n=1 Tax=Paraburkholderia sp. A1RI-2L TaxID=3028367 RepID=UPI003B7A5893